MHSMQWDFPLFSFNQIIIYMHPILDYKDFKTKKKNEPTSRSVERLKSLLGGIRIPLSDMALWNRPLDKGDNTCQEGKNRKYLFYINILTT